MLRVVITFVFVVLLTAVAHAGNPACPKESCIDVELATKLKAELKVKLARDGFPTRLHYLVDKLPNCASCIKKASPSIVEVRTAESVR